jgi:hypothetical protein
VFHHQGAAAFSIESQDAIASERIHVRDQFSGGGGWKEITVKEFTRHRLGNSPVGSDHPDVETEHLRDWESKSMAAAGDEDNFNAGFVRESKSRDVGYRDLELGVQQGAIDIDRD